MDIFCLVCHFAFLSPSLWETARFRLKMCPKELLNTKQPANQPMAHSIIFTFSLNISSRSFKQRRAKRSSPQKMKIKLIRKIYKKENNKINALPSARETWLSHIDAGTDSNIRR